MKKTRIGLLLGATALVAASFVTSASAQDRFVTQGWYASIAGGANFVRDADIDGLVIGGIPAPGAEAEFDTGYAALAAIGYSFGNIRTELEVNYRDNDVDSISGVPGFTGGGGEVKAYGAMINLIYDFLPNARFSPYIGVGAGASQVGLKTRVAGVKVVDDEDLVFAYQGILGLAYRLTSNLSINADYRYFGTDDPEFRADVVAGSGTFESEYSAHTVTIGLTYRFGAPPPPPVQPVSAPPPPAPVAAPPPPPPPAPTAPEVYVVFFAFDRSDISPVAAQVLDRAIADFRRTGSARFEVQGFTDTSGSTAYNQALSQRRSTSVANYLTQRGVQPNQIATEALGETRLRVPTADGVKEAENRRSEIRLRR